MAQQHHSDLLSVLHPICCGLDVHKKSISACLLVQDDTGQVHEEIREFSTFTEDLYDLREWLFEYHCPIVAIESTGVYWQAIHNVLEDHIEVVLVNARHVKNVPGRKTDVSDAKWLAGLLRHGLLKGSFIPDKEVRQWRQLWSLRVSYMETLGDYKRRVHKHLQSCNIKIDSVASGLFTVTGRNLMQLLLVDAQDITMEQVEQCTRGSLRKKAKELYLSIKGFMDDHARYILSSLLEMVALFEAKIEEVTHHLKSMMRDHAEVLERLDQIPGVNDVGACGILAMVGPDLSAFPKVGHFCSWAGMCPGNNKSAGKRGRSRSPVKKQPLRTLMVELAWSASRKKDSYYKEKFYRLKSRIGPKPAICAVAHRMVKAIYHIICGQEYIELGAQYLDKHNEAAKLARLKNQAKKLGFSLVPAETT